MTKFFLEWLRNWCWYQPKLKTAVGIHSLTDRQLNELMVDYWRSGRGTAWGFTVIQDETGRPKAKLHENVKFESEV